MIIPDRFCSTDAAMADAGCHAIDLIKTPDRSRTASATGRVNRSYDEVAEDVDVNQSVATASRAARPESAHSFKLWENDEFSFGDLVDVINPLQHIPIIATIYRNWTHDKIGFAPRVIGGAIWGRIGGFVSGLVNAAVEWLTGKDIGDHIYNALFDAPGDSGIKTAANTKVHSATDPSAASSVPLQEQGTDADGALSDLPIRARSSDLPSNRPPHAETQRPWPSSSLPVMPGEILSARLLQPYRVFEDRDQRRRGGPKLRLTA